MKINFISIAIISASVYSCSSNGNQNADLPMADDGMVVVSLEQFKAMNMEIGSATKVRFDNELTVQGVIEPSPNAKAYVTSPVGAIIKAIMVNPSALVSKGQKLIKIEGTDVLNTQIAFEEVYNQYLLAKANHERLSQLALSGITSQKDLLQAESDYRTLDAKLYSYKVLLQRIGLNPDIVLKGNFSDEAYLTSPIDGTVSRIETVIGKSIKTDEPLAEVINTKNLLLKFYVFINQVNSVKPGQKITVDLPGTGNLVEGKVISVGFDANTENKAVECFASLGPTPKVNMVSGMRVTAKVCTEFDYGWALPASAIQRKGQEYFVYVVSHSEPDRYQFKELPVHVGMVKDTMVQVFDSTLTRVLLKGGYELTLE